MTSSLERLDAAYADVEAATGPDFLRRLGDYADLLKTDKKIMRAVEGLRQEVVDADEDLTEKDAGFVAELVAIRRQLAEREPKADDSGEPYPGPYDAFAENSSEWHKWSHTLANFDAIAENRGEKVDLPTDLDTSRSRSLVKIMEGKLHGLVIPFNETPAPRPDLRDLLDATHDVGHSEVEAYEAVERLANDSGYFALIHIEEVASRIEPQRRRRLKTPEERHEILEEALKAPDLMRIPEILRPQVARGPLDETERQALERIEKSCRKELDALHRPLRKRLDREPLWKKAWDLGSLIPTAVLKVGALIVAVGAIYGALRGIGII